MSTGNNTESDTNEGFVVNVPISPRYTLYYGASTIPIIIQYAGGKTFPYWCKIGKFFPSLPTGISSQLPKIVTADNNALLWRTLFGSFFVIIGNRLLSAARKTMKKNDVMTSHGSNVKHLVSDGPFAFTRNPMYVGCFSIVFGASLLFDNYLHLYAMIGNYLYLQFVVIPREEKGLINYFGEEFTAYCSKVPRWLICNWF